MRGSRGRPRRAWAVAGLAAGLLCGAAAPAQASAEPLAGCTATAGVILAVDFAHWGGPLLRSCGGTPTTGYDLLNEGGWSTTGTVHDGSGFICRIGYSGYDGGVQYPTTATEACVVTPPATAYWSYWHAGPGQSTWSYSQVGPASYQPPPGSVELWTFGGASGAGGQGAPAISPAALRVAAAPPPTRPPRPTPSPSHRVPESSATSAHPAAVPTVAVPTGAVSAAASTVPAPTRAGQPLAGSPPAAAPAGAVVDAAPAPAAPPVRGSPLPAVAGLALVGVLAGAGALARRRRRADRR